MVLEQLQKPREKDALYWKVFRFCHKVSWRKSPARGGHEKDFGQDRDFTSFPEFSWKVKRDLGSLLENYYSREDFQGEKKKS